MLKINKFIVKLKFLVNLQKRTHLIIGFRIEGMAVCIAVLDRNSTPLALSTNDTAKELSFHYVVHTSIDVIEEKCNISSNPGVAKTSAAGVPANAALDQARDLYLGILYSTEAHKVYGFVTNTKIKFIVIVESSNTTLRDNEIRQMFRKLHIAYTNLLSNPFYIPGTSIESKKFFSVIDGLMAPPALPAN